MAQNNDNNTATICSVLEGPAKISHETIPMPPLGAGDVLIRTAAAALNFPDLLMTYGKYQFKPELPFVIGMEGAGEILEIGANVSGFQVGQRVIFKGKTGATQRYVAVAEKDVTLAPKNLSYEEAAAYSVTFLTAYVSLVRRGRLQAGEWVLITGAGGGVGQASVAVAKALGANVIATASDSQKLGIAKASGADVILPYSADDFDHQIRAVTGGNGVDILLDPVGGDVLKSSLLHLAPLGRALIVGFASGSFGEVDLQRVRDLGQEIVGVRAGEYGRRNPAAGQSAWQELVTLTEEKDLKPHIGRVWDEGEVKAALVAMERREISGKQVIRIGAE